MHASVNRQSRAALQELPQKKYANETSAQRLQRREAAWREKQQQEQKQQTPIWLLFPRLRKRELERIFILRWRSRTLPDDEAGRGDLRLMADHLAQLGKKYVEAWAKQFGLSARRQRRLLSARQNVRQRALFARRQHRRRSLGSRSARARDGGTRTANRRRRNRAQNLTPHMLTFVGVNICARHETRRDTTVQVARPRQS